MPTADWQWSWVLCDQGGEPLPGAHVGRGRRLIFARNHEAEARITLSLYDEACVRLFEVLRNGIPQLRVYLRIPGEAEARLVFSGLWTPMNGGNAVGEQSSVNLVFKDAFNVLRYRLVGPAAAGDPTPVFIATDAGIIAVTLIHNTEVAYGATSIATHPAWVEPTVDRDRAYDVNKNLADAVTELTEVLGGFDWFPVYVDPRENDGNTMQFWIAAEQGSDQEGARFEFGDGTLANCKGYSFTGTLPVNRVLALGAQDTGAGTPLKSEQADGESFVRYGTYMQTVSATDVVEQATLDDKAKDALRPGIGLVTQFTGDPAKCPLPWRDFWLGDTIRWNVDDGAMQERTAPRAQTIELGLDDSDNIEDLVVGIDPEASGSYLAPLNTERRYVQQQRELLRRLNTIERRVGV